MQAARIRKRRLAPKDARCRASAFEQKTGGRDGLPSGKPLRRLRRTEDNNDILRLVNVTAECGSHGPPAFAGSTTTPSNWSKNQHPTPTP